MAISTGQTVTRDLTAKTQGQLSELISKASSKEEAYGFDQNGLKAFEEESGTNQVSTVDIQWRESEPEVKQVFEMNLNAAETALDFTGHGVQGKISEFVLNSKNSIDGDRLFVFIDGTEYDFGTVASSTTTTGAQFATAAASLLNRSNISSIDSASSSGATLTVRFVVSAGNSTTVSISARGNNESGTTNIIGSTTVVRTVQSISAGADVGVSVTSNIPLGLAKKLGFGADATTNNFDIPAGGSLHWYDIANHVAGLIQSADGIESRSGSNGSGYFYTLSSGYAVSDFTVRLELIRSGVQTNVDIDANFTSTGTATYASPVTESYGSFKIQIQDPLDDEVYNLVVSTLENTTITDIEKLVETAVSDTVIGQDELGVDRYLSSIVSVTTGPITASTDSDGEITSNFTLTFTWGSSGPATITVDSDNMNEIDESDTNGFSTVANTTTGVAGTPSTTGISWDHISTSATLQPGGDTTHYATLVFTK